MAKPKTLYPIKNRWVHEAPYGVHVPESAAIGSDLVASGAFTDDPTAPDVDHDAPDLTVPTPTPELLPAEPVSGKPPA